MKGYKFIVQDGPTEFAGVPLPSDPRFKVKGMAAFVIAWTRDDAIKILADDLAKHGDVPWHEVATITEVDLDQQPCVALVVGNPPILHSK